MHQLAKLPLAEGSGALPKEEKKSMQNQPSPRRKHHLSLLDVAAATRLDSNVPNMLRMVREKIAAIESGEHGLRFDEIPGSTTITYTVGFALDRFYEMGSERSAQAAFDTLDDVQIRVCEIIRQERGLPPLQYRQSWR